MPPIKKHLPKKPTKSHGSVRMMEAFVGLPPRPSTKERLFREELTRKSLQLRTKIIKTPKQLWLRDVPAIAFGPHYKRDKNCGCDGCSDARYWWKYNCDPMRKKWKTVWAGYKGMQRAMKRELRVAVGRLERELKGKYGLD
jgi:hypothetical protein